MNISVPIKPKLCHFVVLVLDIILWFPLAPVDFVHFPNNSFGFLPNKNILNETSDYTFPECIVTNLRLIKVSMLKVIVIVFRC